MTNKEKLERLRNLESTADDCMNEACGIMEELDINSWYRISDDIQAEISRLEAKLEMEDS